jgi:hypothetical protein
MLINSFKSNIKHYLFNTLIWGMCYYEVTSYITVVTETIWSALLLQMLYIILGYVSLREAN